METRMNRETILQIAQECNFSEVQPGDTSLLYATSKEIERFAHRIQKETLEKAADKFDNKRLMDGKTVVAPALRRMAAEIEDSHD